MRLPRPHASVEKCSNYLRLQESRPRLYAYLPFQLHPPKPMEATLEEKKQFLLRRPAAFIYSVSAAFPLSIENLRQYKDTLYWDVVAYNEAIAWNTDIVDEFKDLLFVESTFEFSEPFSINRALPWDSVEFVKRYEDLWDWELIASNDMLKGECLAYYMEHLKQYEWYTPPEPEVEKTEEEIFMQKLVDEYDPFPIYPREELREKYQDFHDFLMLHPDLAHKEMDWKAFSKDANMYWTTELVEKYEEHWDWKELSENRSMPLTLDFMKRFEDRLVWHGTEDEPDEEGLVGVSMEGIGNNFWMAWTIELLEAFHEKMGEHNSILHSTATEWTLPLLDCYSRLFDHHHIPYRVWNTLFAEFNEEENMMAVLDEVVKSGFVAE